VNDQIIAKALDLDARRLGADDRVHVATGLVHDIDTMCRPMLTWTAFPRYGASTRFPTRNGRDY